MKIIEPTYREVTWSTRLKVGLTDREIQEICVIIELALENRGFRNPDVNVTVGPPNAS